MFCPDCANRRAKPLQNRILGKCNKQGRRYFFLTLTVPNVPHINRTFLGYMIQAFNELRESEIWSNLWLDPKRKEWQGVTGGFYSLECVYNSGYRYERDKKTGRSTRTDNPELKGWHPHIHAVIEVPMRGNLIPKPSLDRLKAEWKRITGNAEYLHIKRVYGQSKSGKKQYRRVNRKALKELVKYVTKSVQFAQTPALVGEFMDAFENVRRMQAFGSFLKSDADGAEDLERETGDDTGYLGCSCGGEHRHNEFHWSRTPVHISETRLCPDGTRQLIFDWADDLRDPIPDQPLPLELTMLDVAHSEQKRLGFVDTMPEWAGQARELSLFRVA